MTPELREQLAKLLAGLSEQAGELGLLPEAREPWIKLRRMFQLVGWESASDIEKKIADWQKNQTPK